MKVYLQTLEKDDYVLLECSMACGGEESMIFCIHFYPIQLKQEGFDVII